MPYLLSRSGFCTNLPQNRTERATPHQRDDQTWPCTFSSSRGRGYTRYVALDSSIPVCRILFLGWRWWACLSLSGRWNSLASMVSFVYGSKDDGYARFAGLPWRTKYVPTLPPKGSIGSVSGKSFFDLRISGQSLCGSFQNEAAYLHVQLLPRTTLFY